MDEARAIIVQSADKDARGVDLPFEGSTGGVVRSDPSKEIRLGFLIIFLFFGLGLGWAAFAPLNAAVVAQGVVVVSGSRQTVQHRDGGVVSRLSVHDGQVVKQGDILIELGAPEVLAEERALFAQVIDAEAHIASLAVETGEALEFVQPQEWSSLSGEDAELAQAIFAQYASRKDAEGRPASEANARITGFELQLAEVNRQEALVQQELDSYAPLEPRGLVPLSRMNQLRRSIADLRGQRASLRSQMDATKENRFDELRQLRSQLAELLPKLAGVRARLEETRLRAPSNGTVVGLSVHTVGGVIAAGQRVLDIVPSGHETIIEARVRPIDADNIAPGQKAEVKITAFSGRTAPVFRGIVGQISADRLTDDRTGEGYFLARIVVPPTEVREESRERSSHYTLQPGLPAQVVVPTRARTALQYIFEPIGQAMWRSFREE